MNLSKKLALVGATLAVAMSGLVATAPGASAAMAMTADQSTALRDGQTVSLSGSGFGANKSVFIVQCSTRSQAGCDTAGVKITSSDAQGNMTADFVVHTGDFGNGTCPTAPGELPCYLAATSDPSGATDAATLDIDFAPILTATPAKGVEDGDTITVAGSGFLPNATAYLTECSSTSAGQAGCDIATLAQATVGADGTLTAELTVHSGAVGTGSCDDGTPCYVVATTDISGTDQDQIGVAKFTFGEVAQAAATKTTAAYSAKAGKISGKVTASGAGVKGLKVTVQQKVKNAWKAVATVTTKAGGKYAVAVSKAGSYRAHTAAATGYKASNSATVKVRS